MSFRIIGDEIEYDFRPVARFIVPEPQRHEVAELLSLLSYINEDDWEVARDRRDEDNASRRVALERAQADMRAKARRRKPR